MSYNFKFNSPAVGRIQPFEYSYATTNEYVFTYGRDIFSDLSIFNAPIFVERKRRGIFCNETYLTGKVNKDFNVKNTSRMSNKPKFDFNIRQDITAEMNRKDFNIRQDITAETEKSNVSFNERQLIADKCLLYAGIIKEIFAKQNINNTNIFDNDFVSKDINRVVIVDNIKPINKIFSLENFEYYFLTENNIRIINTFKNKILKELKCCYTNIYNNSISFEEPNKTLIIYDMTVLSNPNNNLDVYNYNYIMSELNYNKIYIYNNFFVNKPINNLKIDNSLTVFESNINKVFINKNINIAKIDKHLSVHQEIAFQQKELLTRINTFDYLNFEKQRQNVYINQGITFQVKPENVFYNKYELQGYLCKNHTVFFNLPLSITKQIKESYTQYKIPKLSKNNKKFLISRDIILGYHARRKVNFNKGNLFVYKFKSDVFIKQNIHLFKEKHTSMSNDTEVLLTLFKKQTVLEKHTNFLYKAYHNFSFNITNVVLYKDRYNFNINNTESFWYKNKHKSIINNTELFMYRNGYESLLSNKLEQFYRERYGFSINNTNLFLDKDRHSFNISNTNVLLKTIHKEFNTKDYTEFLYKDKYRTSINIGIDNLSDLELPLGIIIHNNTIGLMIPSKEAYKEKNIQKIDINIKKTFIENEISFLTPKQKNTNIINNIFVITETKKAFLEYYHNIMLSKTIQTSLMDKLYVSVEKHSKDGIIYNNIDVTKKYKEIFIKDCFNIAKKNKLILKNNEDIFINYRPKEVIFNDNITLDKLLKITTITDSYWIDKKDLKISVFKQEQTSKNIYEAYIVNDDVIVDKVMFETSINDNIALDIKQKQAIINKNTNMSKDKINVDVQDYVFITKQQYEANPYVSEMMQLQKVIKDLERPVDKTYNWVWAYQPDDPIDPNYDYYGLDELLLPEKDVDYSTFEDIIFDKKTMMPKKPVKILNNNTFIAKYPTKHPTPDYEEIGIVYIDVPSELMYALFMKFYQIWYANIYKFGNMSMVDSLKVMLDYMYAHIVLNYSGTEYLEPALRVFRQIRWFGETSVMHNAQYKITCEYEDLKSNLQTGECMIKNQLSGFYVNTTLKVLSTSPTSIGQEAYIKLYALNRDDSKITFSTSITDGSIEVYINNSLVDTIYSSNSSVNYSYDLPATTTENEITLKRPASGNIGYCYIGNIVIKNGVCKNLNIEYDPELKSGNLPLNDVVNKMVILANMYDNQQEAFEQFRKGNLAVSELYKRLESYWELHHANKIKGKRLTIKET